MDNFDLTKFLTEGKLYEAMSPQDVVDIADTVAEEFTKESAEEGDFLIYTVGKMEGESFELDTDVSAQTPKDLDTRGVGEGWGGIFRIKPSADGYEVRNAEKGGLVAMIDPMGNFRMLSAAESRDELDMDRYNDELDMKDGEKTDYMERRREMSDYMEEGKMLDETVLLKDRPFDYQKDYIAQDRFGYDFDELESEEQDEVLNLISNLEDEQMNENKPSNKMKKSELKEMIRAAMLAEMEVEETEVFEAEEEDVEDVDVDVDIEDVEDVDIDADVEDAGEIDVENDAKVELTGDKAEVSDNLEAALEAARKLGDEKLVDQIGNTITFFTRAHIVKEADVVKDEAEMELEEVARMKKLAGLK